MKIDLTSFKGIAPRYQPHLLPEQNGQKALNCKLGSGGIEPFAGLLTTGASVDNYAGMFYLYRYQELDRWLFFAGRKHIITSPVPGDIHGRIYWSNDIEAGESATIRFSTAALLGVGGVINETTQSYPLGVPAPLPTLTAEYTIGLKKRAYDQTQTYNLGECVIQAGKLYRCTTAITASELFTVSHWTEVACDVPDKMRMISGYLGYDWRYPIYRDVDYATEGPTTAFSVGDIVAYQGVYWQCFQKTLAGEPWNADKWLPVVGRATTVYSASATYAVGNVISYQDQTHICMVAIETPEAFTHSKWAKIYGSALMGYIYNANVLYQLTELTIQEKIRYQCTTAITSPEAFTSTHWQSDLSSITAYWSYVKTYVNEFGEEGPPSPASNIVAVLTNDIRVQVKGFINALNNAWVSAHAYAVGDEVVVTAGQVSTAYVCLIANSNTTFTASNWLKVAKIRLYRSNIGSTASAYQVVTDITMPAATVTYLDTASSAILGRVLPSTDWYPSVQGYGLIVLANGAIAFYRDRSVYISLPYQPHAVPVGNRYTVDSEIMGLASFGTSVMVITRGMPVILSGSDPATMLPEKAEQGYACVSRQSVVDLGYACIYASPVGLIVAGMGKSQVVTAELIDPSAWQQWQPATMRSWQYRGMYISMAPTVSFLFDPSTGDLVTLGFVADGGYYDGRYGDLYFNIDGVIKKFDADPDQPLTAVWRSKRFEVPQSVVISAVRVIAESYPLIIRLYDRTTLITERQVVNGRPFRVTAKRATGIEIEVEGTATIRRIMVGSSIDELQG